MYSYFEIKKKSQLCFYRILSIEAPKDQAMPIFTGVFVIIWVGAAIVTINAQLLGGAVSFFQSVCVIGYCLFPIVVSVIIAAFVKLIWVRLPIAIVTFAWSTYGKYVCNNHLCTYIHILH
jgi:hypothetical protein